MTSLSSMHSQRLSRRVRLLLFAGFVLGVTGLLLLTGGALGLLMVLPALTVVAILIGWPEPGLDLILRLADKLRPRPRPRRRVASRGARTLAGAARGGRLIAVSLAGRAPPRAVCCR